jgi:hypothetical protein
LRFLLAPAAACLPPPPAAAPVDWRLFELDVVAFDSVGVGAESSSSKFVDDLLLTAF